MRSPVHIAADGRASLSQRWCASAVNNIATALAVIVALVLTSEVSPTVVPFMWGLNVAAIAVYHVVPVARSGQTFGKRVVGIRVRRIDGSRRVGFARATTRWVVTMAAVVPPLGWIVFGPVLSSRERRGLHDLVAGTHVVIDPGRARA